MHATLTIKDETLYGQSDEAPSFTLDFPRKIVSAREIVETRIRREVEKHNNAEPAVSRFLIKPNLAEKILNNFKPKEKKPIDWREQYAAAVEAFERNGFILLVDDLQIENLNQIIEIEPQTSVTFLKLVTLVGG